MKFRKHVRNNSLDSYEYCKMTTINNKYSYIIFYLSKCLLPGSIAYSHRISKHTLMFQKYIFEETTLKSNFY